MTLLLVSLLAVPQWAHCHYMGCGMFFPRHLTIFLASSLLSDFSAWMSLPKKKASLTSLTKTVPLLPSLLWRLRWEDHLSPGVQGQTVQHQRPPPQKKKTYPFHPTGVTGVWTQGFTLKKQGLYCFRHTSSLFCSGYFGGGGPHKLFAWAGIKLWSSWSLPPE
jgi:hypothetical protein